MMVDTGPMLVMMDTLLLPIRFMALLIIKEGSTVATNASAIP